MEQIRKMTNLQKKIILNKCNEREQNGYDHLNDSDIMDILEKCERYGQPLSRREIESVFEDYLEEGAFLTAALNKENNNHMDNMDHFIKSQIQRSMEIRTSAFAKFNEAYIKEGFGLSKEDLLSYNIIDVSPLIRSREDISPSAIELPQVAEEREKTEQLFREHKNLAILPPYKHFVLKLTDSNYMEVMVKDFDPNCFDKVIFIVKSYDCGYGFWQVGRETEITANLNQNGLAIFPELSIEVTRSETFSDIYEKIPISKISFTKDERDIFLETKESAFRKKFDDRNEIAKGTGIMLIRLIFMINIAMNNHQIRKDKESAEDILPVEKNKKMTGSEKRKRKKWLQSIQTYSIGEIKIISDSKPRRISDRKAIYRTPEWSVRAHVRHLKSGKVVPVKESKHKRKALLDKKEKTEPKNKIIKIKK